MKNNFYRVFDASFREPNIIVLGEDIALCSAASGIAIRIHYRLIRFGKDQIFTTLQEELTVAGKGSAMTITADGRSIAVVYTQSSTGSNPLGYFSGSFNANAQSINWHRGRWFNDSTIEHYVSNPAIAALRDNQLVLAYWKDGDPGLKLTFGQVVGETIEWLNATWSGGVTCWNIMLPVGLTAPTIICDAQQNIFVLGCALNSRDDGLYCGVYRRNDVNAAHPRLLIVAEPKLYDAGYSPTAVCVGRSIHSFFVFNRGSSTQRLCQRDLEIRSIVPENGVLNPTRFLY